MKKRLGFLLLPLMLAAAPMATEAQEFWDPGGDICQKRSSMIDTLVSEFGEQLAEVHKVRGGELLEFHISPAVGTWTALLTNTSSQVSCVVGAGDGLDPHSFENIVEGGVNI